MDTILSKSNASVTKDEAKNNDVKVDMTNDDVMYATDIISSPNFLRIPLKPIGTAGKQRPNDKIINEKG